MKIDMLFIDLLMVGLIFIPYVVLILIGKKAQRKLEKKFLFEASQLNIKPDEIDCWNQNIIGLDNSKKIVLIVQKKGESFLVKTIDLKDVKESKMLLENVSNKIGGKAASLLRQVTLQLKLRSGETDSIEFYNADTCFAQEYELKNAEKWNTVITTNSVSTSRPKYAA